MEHDVDALRAEVAALGAELAEVRGSGDASSISRRRLLTGLAGLGAAGAAGVAAAAPAGAADGDNLVLGQANTATSPTTISSNVGGEQSEVVLGSGP
jgi:hypothetical protein